MPKLTIRDYLQPGPVPALPPWHNLDTRGMTRFLKVSFQSLWNWESRGVGPARTMTKSRRARFRLCDVLAWITPDGPPADHYIRTYLRDHERQAASIFYDLSPAERDWFGKSLLNVMVIPAPELEQLCKVLDRHKAFGTREYA